MDFGKFFNKNNKPESAELLLENFNTIKYQVPRNGKKAAPSFVYTEVWLAITLWLLGFDKKRRFQIQIFTSYLKENKVSKGNKCLWHSKIDFSL